MNVADAVTFHYRGHIHHGGGNRRRGDSYLRGDHGSGERTAGLHALFFGHFGDNRQRGERDIPGTGENRQKVSDDGSQYRDVFRVFAQQLFRLIDQEIEPARDLHGGDGGDHRHND